MGSVCQKLKVKLGEMLTISLLVAMPANIANAQTIVYSETFTTGLSYCPTDPVYDNWISFRLALDTSVFEFTKVTIKGSLDTVGRSCSDTVMVNEMATALRIGTIGDWIGCSGNDWHVGTGCVAGCALLADAIEFTADGTNCACTSPGYILRPAIGNSNWGGIAGATCTAPTQVMTVIFEYAACSLYTNIVVADPACKGGPGSIDLSVIDGTAPYTYAWSSGDTIEDPTGLPAGTYTVEVTDNKGCMFSDTAILTDPVLFSEVICIGDSVQLSADSMLCFGTGPYTYSWTPTADLSCTTCENPYASPTANVTYVVVITDGSAAVDSVEAVVNVFSSLPVADAGVDTSCCEGQYVQLNGSGGALYQWSPGIDLSDSTIANPLALPKMTKDYVMIATNGCGSDTDTVMVTVNLLPVISSSDTSVCPGDSVQLGATGGVTYSWSPGASLDDSTIANPIASPNATTVYTITATSAEGCNGNGSLTVSVDSVNQLITSTSKDTICPNDSVQLLATTCTPLSEDFEGGLNGWNGNSTLWHLETAQSSSPTTSWTYNTGTPIYNFDIGTNMGTLTTPMIDLTSKAPGDTTMLTFNCLYETEDLGTTFDQRWIQISSNGGPFTPFLQFSGEAMNVWHSHSIDLTAYNGDSIQIGFFFNTIDGILNAYWGWSIDDVELPCSGVDTSLTYTWTPTTGLDNPNIYNPKASPDSTTTYVVTAQIGSCSISDTITVYVDTSNFISITPVSQLCLGDSIMLEVTGSPGQPDTSGWTYAWSPGSSLSDTTAAGPYASPTTQTVYQVNVTNICGTYTDTMSFPVKSIPTADAGLDTNFCYGGSVQLTATGGVTYLWSPNSFLSCTACDKTNANPQTDMTYYVTVTDSFGCSDMDSVFVEVNGMPVTAISDKTFICAPGDSVLLSAEGISDCNDYNITNVGYAPVGGTGTAVFLNDDEVSVGLPIGFTFNFYCNDYTTFYISSNGFLTFTNDPNSGCCSGQLIPDLNSPNNLVAFVWDDMFPPGNGTIDYFTTGTAPNRQLVMNYSDIPFCCGSTPEVNTQVVLHENGNHIEIHTAYANNISPGTMGLENIDGSIAHPVLGRNAATWNVVNEGLRFSPLTAPLLDTTLVYSWTPGGTLADSTASSTIATPSGDITYIVEVNDDGCIQTDTVMIFMDTTVISVFADTVICQFDLAQLNVTANTVLSTYQWNPATGLSNASIQNPTASPGSSTDYTVTVVNTAGCEFTSDTVSVTIDMPPTAAFTETSVDLESTFTNTSTNGVSFLWDFGDGFQASISDPVHTYNANGTYNVCLTATNACGSDTFCANVTVALGGCINTVAAFDTIVSGLTVIFADSSSDADSWAWDFGDGNTSTVQNPVNTYLSDGTYNACLVTTNPCSSDTICMVVTVTGNTVPCVPTVASFSSSSIGLDVVFTDGSNDATSWSWDFGDGNSSTAQNPVHTYGADSTYTACLIATNACSADTICDTVTVAASNCTPTIAAFTSSNNGLIVNFTDSSSDATGWAWDFGDGNTATTANPSNTYSVPGTYTVCLVVTNPCSTDSICTSITVTACSTPVASFVSSDNELIVTFTDLSTNATSWAWDFGDGNTSISQNPTYAYSTSGTYYVCLTVTSNCDTNMFCDSVTVTSCATVIASFTYSDSALAVDFTDLSVNADSWSWNFGDGFNAATQNPMHTYALPGSYMVCLTAIGACMSDTICMLVTVGLTGIDDATNDTALEVYPNPTDGLLNLSVRTMPKSIFVSVYNLLGEVVYSSSGADIHMSNVNGPETTFTIDLNHLVNGFYLLKVQIDEQDFMEQLIFSK
ncbi:MAG TPA: PKD domain-containing protein [Flavobacteriales bacterium]|nr:PKD domain-containing protein [Flavobacteriales bacterium]